MGWEYFFNSGITNPEGYYYWIVLVYYTTLGEANLIHSNLQWSRIDMWEGGCYIPNTKCTIIGIFNTITQ